MRAAANEPTSSFKLYWIKSCETHHPGWEVSQGSKGRSTDRNTSTSCTTHTRPTHTRQPHARQTQTHPPPNQVRYWDDRSVLALIRADYPFFLPTFRSYKQVVQRSDAARWLILYKVGWMWLVAVGCGWVIGWSQLAGCVVIRLCSHHASSFLPPPTA
jgi:hypothetical protein